MNEVKRRGESFGSGSALRKEPIYETWFRKPAEARQRDGPLQASTRKLNWRTEYEGHKMICRETPEKNTARRVQGPKSSPEE